MGVFIGEKVCPDCVEAARVTPDHFEPEDHDDD